MTKQGYVKGQSDNLPEVDAMMVAKFFSSNGSFAWANMWCITRETTNHTIGTE